MTPSEQALLKVKDAYIHFIVAGKEVPIPYFISRQRFNYGDLSGKGSPNMILHTLEQTAKDESFDLTQKTAAEIYAFLKEHNLGVDCSGFAYHLLDAYVKSVGHSGLADELVRFHGILGTVERALLKAKRYRRINVATLTSPLNSREIVSVQDIKIGDLIRASLDRPGDHVLIVTGVIYDSQGTVHEIVYVHSSTVFTYKQGPHEEKIVVADPNKTLQQQQWQEMMKDGKPMDEFAPAKGDKVWRLLIVDEILRQNGSI